MILRRPLRGAPAARGRAARPSTRAPPPNPVRWPSAPITRWHGTMIGIGLRPLAAPTARALFGVAETARPARRSSPSRRTGSSTGRARRRAGTACPRGASGTSNSVRVPAKYSSSWRAVGRGPGASGSRVESSSDAVGPSACVGEPDLDASLAVGDERQRCRSGLSTKAWWVVCSVMSGATFRAARTGRTRGAARIGGGRPQVVHGVASARGASASDRRGVEAERRRGRDGRRGRSAGTRRGRRARASARSRRSTGRCPGRRAGPRAPSSRSAPTSRASLPIADSRGRARRACAGARPASGASPGRARRARPASGTRA